MGKVVKKVLKIAAFVAIATFAAPVAAAIGLSAAVGTVAGAAIVGAAAGAATNGILGGGVLNGALMGGLTGGIGGIGKVASTGTGLFGDAYAGTGGPIMGGGAPLIGGSAAAGEGAGAGVGAGAGAGAGAIAPTVAQDAGEIVVSHAPVAAVGGLAAAAPVLASVAGGGAGLLAGGTSTPTVQTNQPAPTPTPTPAPTPTPTATGTPDVAPITVTANVPPAPGAIAAAAPVAASVAGAGIGALDLGGGYKPPTEDELRRAGTAPLNYNPVAGGSSPIASTVGGAAAAGGAKAGLGGTLLDVGKAVIPPLLAGAIVGNPGGGTDPAQQQQDLIDQQKDALATAEKQYADNYNLKTGYAQGLIDDANQYDPEVAGRRAAEAARIRAGLSAANAARGAGGRRAEVIQRQGEIEGGRNATSAYWDAYGTTGAQRVGLQTAGINAIPVARQPSPSDYSTIYGDLTAQQQQKDKEVANVSGLITSGIGAALGSNRG